MNAKTKRQELVANLLRTEAISDQACLRKALQVRGIKVTQATLSRDFAELGVKRVVTPSGRFRYVIPVVAPMEEEAKRSKSQHESRVIGVEFSGRLLLLKTRPACALSLAQEIDHQNIPIIAGTIAGYDTILVIPREGSQREDLLHILQPLLQ